MYNGIVGIRQIIKQIFSMNYNSNILAILLIALSFPMGISGAAWAQSVECQAKTVPRINVIPKTENIKYDFTKTKAQLNSVDVDTISPYGPQHKTTVSGLMSGSIQVRTQAEFIHEKYEQADLGCVYLKNINVEVKIDPTIFIAREYKNGSCYHNAVLNHERKHVREDQLIVNKYVGRIGRSLQDLIKGKTDGFGPYQLDRLDSVQKNVEQAVNQVVTRYNDDMNKERRRRQQAIDSLEEYESIGSRCPKERG